MAARRKKGIPALKAVFWALVANALIMLGMMATAALPAVRSFISPFMFASWITFFSLGIALIVLTLRKKAKGKLKKYLILAGASSAGFFVSVLLHNFLYALAIIFADIRILSYVLKVLSTVFFIIAIFILPITFLIGMIGSIVLFTRKKSRSKK